MRLFALIAVLPYLLTAASGKPHARTYETHQYYALELSTSSSATHASSIAKSLGVELVERIGELDGHWLVRVLGSTPHYTNVTSSPDPIVKRWHNLRRRSKRDSTSHHLRSFTPLSLRKRAKRDSSHIPPRRISHLTLARDDTQTDTTEFVYAQTDLGILDPLLNQQWHLINQEMPDIELNVTGLWARGITGTGVKVALIDDGLDMHSDDLAENFFPEGSYDFNDHTELPEPRLSDDAHGTRCAGEVAAVKNDVCGVGVAYTSKVAGVRILSAPISDADEAAALNYEYQQNDIYSCSWGPPDDGKSLEAPDGLILKAMVNGIHKGRQGKGSIFVFAAGNGGGAEDQCNFDGYTNSIFSITVGAVDRKGLHPYYSELCAAMMVVAPSSGSGDHIHTTDVGKDRCAHNHGGTSAAAPLAVGVFALALQVRPDLTWRDLQYLAVQNAVFFNPDDPDWQDTASGRKFSYKYGYGRLNAGLFVEAAEKWKLKKPQAWFDSPAIHLPDDPLPGETTTLESRQEGAAANDDHVAPSQDAGDGSGVPTPDEGGNDGGIGVTPPPVVRPTGTRITAEGIKSTYTVTQDMLDDSNLETLEHVTVRVWIEHQRRGDVEVELTSPKGYTSVLARVRRFDESTEGFPGWKFMSLKHWGEDPVGTWTITVKDAINPERVGSFIAWSLQLWGESVDPELTTPWAPAEIGQPDEEEIGSEPTASMSKKPKPTDHLPDDHGEASGEAHQPGLGGQPTSVATATQDEAETPTGDVDEGFVEGIKNLASGSTWIAGAGAIVVLAGAGVGAFFYFRARRRRQNMFGFANNGEGARGAYQPVGEEDVPMGLLSGRMKLGRGGAGNEGGSKELYDAFGDGPSDESDDGLGGDERTGLRYHDEFLGDDEDDVEPPRYKDEPEDVNKGEGSGTREGTPRRELDSHSGSTGSWEDAGQEVPPRV